MIGVAAVLFVAGAVLASFLGVVAHRVPRGESFVGGRSHCDHCGAEVAAYDNIPLVSWLLLRGRCRSCGGSIPARYPLLELALGVAFAATYLVFKDDGGQLALGLVFCALLAAITLTDLEYRIIPNTFLLVAAVVGIAIAVPTDPDGVVERLIAVTAAGGGLFLVAFMYPRGMGMGDVKLAAVMGIYLGRAVAPALLIGFLAGAIIGMALIARHGAAARKQAVPFGPFLALGGVVGLLVGDDVVQWYLDEFFPSD